MATASQQNERCQNRVMLWAPPRSLSTAFERCISTQMIENDIFIYHEPYTTCYYLGPDKQKAFPSFFGKFLVKDRKYTYKYVKDALEKPYADKKHMFVKDLAHSIDTKHDFLPEGFQHTFLIRSPQKILCSFEELLDKYPTKLFGVSLEKDILPKGMIFKEMADLFDHVTQTLGQKAIVIDADDMVQNPLEILKIYCNETGLPYSDSMTTGWRKDTEDLKMWAYSKKLMRANKFVGQYDRAFSSNGLGKPSKRSKNDEIPTDFLKRAIAFAEPFYQKLYEHRIRIPIDNAESAEQVDKVD